MNHDPVPVGILLLGPDPNIYGVNRYDEFAAMVRELPTNVGFISSRNDILPSICRVPGTENVLTHLELSEFRSHITSRFTYKSLVNISERFGEFSGIDNINPSELQKQIKLDFGSNKTTRPHYTKFDSIVDELGKLFDKSIYVVDLFNIVNSYDALCLSVWLSRKNTRPAVFLSASRLNSKNNRIAKTIESQYISSDMLLSQIEKKFSLSHAEAITAHKIWNLSRNRFHGSRTDAVNINMNAARELCQVVSDTYSDKIRESFRPKQRPGPIKFRFSEDGITTQGGHNTLDTENVVAAAATSLMERCKSVARFGSIDNQLPTFGKTLERVEVLLTVIIGGNFDDVHIVALGMEFNASQWEISNLKHQVSENSLAELTGLFANIHLFLDRFPIWRSYSARIDSDCSGAIANFNVSNGVLRAAQREENLLDGATVARVKSILDKVTTENSPPPLLDGVVASGENLSATVIGGLSDLVASEGKELGGEMVKQMNKNALKSLVNFTKNHWGDILKIMEGGGHQWSGWLESISQNFPNDLGTLL